jgi:predicted nucleic acid-binding Zn ribbon protein
MRRRAPRPAGVAVAALTSRLAPRTALAEVQRVWPVAVGAAIAAEAQPTAEHDGVVTVSCNSAVWAQELDLMGPDLVARLNARRRVSRFSAILQVFCGSWDPGEGGLMCYCSVNQFHGPRPGVG